MQDALRERGVSAELVTFTTLGDRRLDEPLRSIGAKGLFTEELESALLACEVDCCVHSLKDLPTEDSAGVVMAALLAREDPRDVVVMAHERKDVTLQQLPAGAKVGTSSLRRRAQLLAMRPDLEVVELRGNVPTRLRKVSEGLVDAAILAAAGLLRLGIAERINGYLQPPHWLPAAGQGAIAVQARGSDADTVALLARLDHAPTSIATRAERAFLAALDGGCQVPIGALCEPHAGRWSLHGLIADEGGGCVLRDECVVDPSRPEVAGQQLAAGLRARGGGELLARLRMPHAVPSPQPE